MKRLNSKEIKKALFGLVLTDASIFIKRFSIYTKEKEFAENIEYILKNISGVEKINNKINIDKRWNPPIIGWRVWTTNHPYFEKIYKIFYSETRKHITPYIVSRLDEIAFAYAWMGDGYLEHHKNRKSNSIQNLGYFCLESFPPEELELIIKRLKYYSINSRLSKYSGKKTSGYGYRIKITGLDLQKFIDTIYPYILDCFKYKTKLYYKNANIESKYILNNLSNTEHIILNYDNVEDIVRHS
jgi:hypothetical protein